MEVWDGGEAGPGWRNESRWAVVADVAVFTEEDIAGQLGR